MQHQLLHSKYREAAFRKLDRERLARLQVLQLDRGRIRPGLAHILDSRFPDFESRNLTFQCRKPNRHDARVRKDSLELVGGKRRIGRLRLDSRARFGCSDRIDGGQEGAWHDRDGIKSRGNTEKREQDEHSIRALHEIHHSRR